MTTEVPTTPDPIAPVGRSSNHHPLWIGVLLIVVGIAAIAAPVVSTLFTATWIAAFLISAGVAKLVYAFQTRAQEGFVWKLLLSLLYIGTGLTLILNPFGGVITLTLLLGSYLLTEGVFELVLAFRLRPQPNWTWALSNGIVTLLLGGLVWFQWPFNAPWLIGTLVGASILFTGVSRVMLSLRGRQSDQPSQPDQPAAV